MLFNSIEFLFFFPTVFLIYWYLSSYSYKYQNIFLLISSYFFYGWWDWRFLSLILISSFSDYFVGKQLFLAETKIKQKILLLVSIFINIGLLAYFKYFNFFIDSFADLLNNFGFNSNRSSLQIILPVGISFYTFQTLSYTIDIYKKRIRPTSDLVAFFTFVSFFPQLVAGPIERAKKLLPQFENQRKFKYTQASSGSKLIIMGLFKKMVIADNTARLVDVVFNNPSSYSGFPLIVAIIFFAFQIYCDFSGYSDIAVGIAKILGFELINNFNKPYFATSLSDFWIRWHISLSMWFRDYVYIPLGGSKINNFRTSINIIITFAISGLWHGANWTFVVWGAVHGLMLIIERFIKSLKKTFVFFRFSLPKTFKTLIVFIVVCFAWVFFRANSLEDAFFIFNNIFIDFNDYTSYLSLSTKFRGLGLTIEDIIIIIFFITILIIIEFLESRNKLKIILERSRIIKWGYYYFLLISIMLWGVENSADNFIYFQF